MPLNLLNLMQHANYHTILFRIGKESEKLEPESSKKGKGKKNKLVLFFPAFSSSPCLIDIKCLRQQQHSCQLKSNGKVRYLIVANNDHCFLHRKANDTLSILVKPKCCCCCC